MNKNLNTLFWVVCICLFGYFGFGYLSSYIGWYGYEKWKYRVGTSNIEESQNRGVFVKELNFEIVDFPDSIKGFVPYIEKGFKFGMHSSEETLLITNTKSPYQLSFNFKPSEAIGLHIDDEQLKKFDSCNAVKGFLNQPVLPDTIIVTIIGMDKHAGFIKIWN